MQSSARRNRRTCTEETEPPQRKRAFTSRKEALREISRNFRETFVMGALEGRYLAGPATWSPHLAGPATWNPQWDLTATARSPPAGLPWELSRRFERSERDADLPNTVYGRSAPARMSDAGQVPRSRNRKFRKATKAFAQNRVQKRVLLAYF